MNVRSICCLLVGWGLAAPIAAEIYRCQGAQGEAAFSHRPCSGGQAPGPVVQEFPAPKPVGVRASERDWLTQRTREKARRAKSPRRTKVSTQDKRKAERKHAYRCERKRASLDALNAQRRQGYKAGRGEKLRRRHDALQDYLSAFCS